MRSQTLDELMIVNPGSPVAIEMVRLRSAGSRGACPCACRQPVLSRRLFLGPDGIVYQVDRPNVRHPGQHFIAADGAVYAVDR